MGQLGVSKPARGGGAVGDDQASGGRSWRQEGWQGEQLGASRPVGRMIRGDQAGRQVRG